MPVGGDISEIQFNHPTLGSVTVYPKSAEDSTFDLGGFRSADDANMIDGGGRMIDQMNRVRPSLETLIAWDMNSSLELEKLNAIAKSPVLSDITISHISGSVYSMKGKPVGDLLGNGNTATFPLKIAGSGEIKKIV